MTEPNDRVEKPQRPLYDLFSPYGWRALLLAVRHRYYPWPLWRDTFGRFGCMVRGHRGQQEHDGTTFCIGCNHYVTTPERFVP